MDVYFFCLVLNLLTNWLSGYLVQTSRSTPNAKLNLLDYRGCTNLFNATLLILGLVNYEFPTKLRCRLSGTVAPLGICYRESFLVSYLRYIYRLWNTLPQGQGIPYLSTCSYIYTPSYQIPTQPNGFFSPGTSIGASTSSTDVYPKPNIPNWHGPQPNISNRCRSWSNNIFPLPQLLLRRCGLFQPTWSLTKYLQQTAGLPQSLPGHEHLPRQTPRFLPTFSKRRWGPTNFPQPPLQLPEIFSTDSRAFKTGTVTPPGMSEILAPGGPPTCSSEAPFIFMIKILFLIFLWPCALRTHPFQK